MTNTWGFSWVSEGGVGRSVNVFRHTKLALAFRKRQTERERAERQRQRGSETDIVRKRKRWSTREKS